jgi:hypothetical protein
LPRILDFRRPVVADGMVHLNCPEKSLYGTVRFVNARISAAKRGKRRAVRNIVNGTAPLRRLLNAKRRPRECVTAKEVEKPSKARARAADKRLTRATARCQETGISSAAVCCRWAEKDKQSATIRKFVRLVGGLGVSKIEMREGHGGNTGISIDGAF